jgi:integrase
MIRQSGAVNAKNVSLPKKDKNQTLLSGSSDESHTLERGDGSAGGAGDGGDIFLAAQAKNGTAPSTLNRRLSAIRLMHLGARLVSPHNAVEIQEVMRGIRRLSTRGVVKKEAAVDEQIKRMVDTCDPSTYQGQRDRALLLLGFAGALRRSELVALDVAHLNLSDEGFVVTIAKSKPTRKVKDSALRSRECLTRPIARCSRCSIGWPWPALSKVPSSAV